MTEKTKIHPRNPEITRPRTTSREANASNAVVVVTEIGGPMVAGAINALVPVRVEKSKIGLSLPNGKTTNAPNG